MLPRIVFWLLLAFAVWWLVFPHRQSNNRRPHHRPPREKPPNAPMLQCAYCGVHFPGDETVTSSDGRPFCSKAHEKAAVHAG